MRKYYTVKLLIPAVPFPIEWTTKVLDLKKAVSKAKGEIKIHFPDLVLARGRVEQEVIGVKEIDL